MVEVDIVNRGIRVIRRHVLLLLLILPFQAPQAAEPARFLSQVVPETVQAGSRFAVVVQFRNQGPHSWGEELRLRQVGHRIWGRVNARAQKRVVAPGETATFRITLKAPKRPGSYRLRWRLSEGGRRFEPTTPAVTIKVTAEKGRPAWGATFVHQRLPGLQAGDPPFALLQTGRAYPVTMIFKNEGERPWRPSEVRLVAVGADGAETWSVSALPLPADTTVAPGEIHAFHFTILTPLEPGLYPFQWRLQRRGRPFGEASPKVVVTVR